VKPRRPKHELLCTCGKWIAFKFPPPPPQLPAPRLFADIVTCKCGLAWSVVVDVRTGKLVSHRRAG